MSCDETIFMKKGDRLPSIEYYLQQPGKALTVLPDSVSFKFEPEGGGAVVSGSATVLGLVGGTIHVQYDWGVADTATAGRYRAEFVATFSGKEMTFPNGDGLSAPQYITLVISDDVS